MVRGIGRDQLCGAPVMATDLRASASLVIAGLSAKRHHGNIENLSIILSRAMRIWWSNCKSWAQIFARSGSRRLGKREADPNDTAVGGIAVYLDYTFVIFYNLADYGQA